MIIILIILLVVIVAAVVWGIASYNEIIKLKNRIEAAWAQIDVQLKRRHDLIPNLVETVRGYAAQERETLEAVIAARNGATAASGPAQAAAGENQLSQALGHLFALAESYPDLKANQGFVQLQGELTASEDKIAYSRQLYNDSVLGYNAKIQSFPINIYANSRGLRSREYFEVDEESRGPVHIEF